MADTSTRRVTRKRVKKLVSGRRSLREKGTPQDLDREPQAGTIRSEPILVKVTVLLLAMSAAAIATVAMRQGVGLAFDSINYLTAAYNFGSGHGLRTGTLEPLTIAPPGLSLMLAPAVFVGWGEESAARAMVALCYAVTVLLAFRLARRHLESQSLALVVAAITAFSPSLLYVMTVAWTEPMFVVIVLAFMLASERAWNRWSAKDVIFMVLLTWAAFSFRYLGLFLLPCGVVCLLRTAREDRARSAVGAALFSLGALVFPLLWMARNHAADGTLMGPRPNSIETLSGLVSQTIDTLQLWVWPEVTNTWAYWLALGVGACLAVVLYFHRSAPATAKSMQAGRYSLLPMGIVSVLYLVFLAYGELSTSVDPIDRRLLAPLFVPLIVLVLRGVESVMLRAPSIMPVAAAAMSFMVVVQSVATVDAALDYADKGIFMQTDEFRKNTQALALAGIGTDDVIYSNVRMNFWIALRHQPARYWPRHFVHHSSTAIDEVPQFVDSLGCGPTYAAWHGKDSDPPGEYLSPTELRQFVNLRELQTFPSGVNYLVESKVPVAPKSDDECRRLNLRL